VKSDEPLHEIKHQVSFFRLYCYALLVLNSIVQQLIRSRKDLKLFIDYEKQLYGAKTANIGFCRPLSEKGIIWRYLSLLRYEEYHINCHHPLRAKIYKYRLAKMSRFYGLNIGPNIINAGFLMYHVGYVLINADRIGRNFCCAPHVALIAGGHNEKNPVLGDNIVIGYGATVCGGVDIPDGVAIGSCSFVNKSFSEKNVCLAGSPAKVISNNGSSTWGGTRIYQTIRPFEP